MTDPTTPVRKERLLVESIKVDRAPDTSEDITPFAVNIRDNGQQHPILVTGKFELIDGLRRLEGIKRLGYVTVDAVITDDFYEACNQLSVMHDLNTATISRLRELGSWLDALLEVRRQQLRDGYRRPKAEWKGNIGLYQGHSRPYWIKAIGRHYEILKRLEKRAAQDDVTSANILARVEAGEIDLSQARQIMERTRRRDAPVPTRLTTGEQDHILSAAVVGLRAQVIGLRKLQGAMITVPGNKLNDYLRGLSTIRSDITALIRVIEGNREQGK